MSKTAADRLADALDLFEDASEREIAEERKSVLQSGGTGSAEKELRDAIKAERRALVRKAFAAAAVPTPTTIGKTAREVIAELMVGPSPGFSLGDADAEGIITSLDAAGFVIVPKEPTVAKAEAFLDADTGWDKDPTRIYCEWYGDFESFKKSWAAALIAASSQDK